MKDKELRRIIGVRAKQRRLELGVNQPYIAEKMGVTASTDGQRRVQRGRNGADLHAVGDSLAAHDAGGGQPPRWMTNTALSGLVLASRTWREPPPAAPM